MTWADVERELKSASLSFVVPVVVEDMFKVGIRRKAGDKAVVRADEEGTLEVQRSRARSETRDDGDVSGRVRVGRRRRARYTMRRGKNGPPLHKPERVRTHE